MFAGRNISVTHLALGATRVENTIATLGQAVGTAAAMCVNKNELPRGIYQRHIKELQQRLIKDDQFIPDLKNEDEGDPCLSGVASASSEKKNEIFQTMQGIDGKLIPLDVARIVITCVESTRGDIDNVWVKVCSENKEPTLVTMGAQVVGNGMNNFCEFGPVVTSQVEVPPMREGWVKFPIHITVPIDELIDSAYIHIWLEAAEGISWRSVSKLSFYDRAGKRLENGKWKFGTNRSLRHSVEEPVERIANCSAGNVINGYSRIINADNYEWVSDPNEAMPQWINVDFKEATDINSVSVVFDTDITNPGTCWHDGSKSENGWPTCVKDYEVEMFSDGEWKQVAKIDGNFMRKRIHNFETLKAEKILVNVLSTWGDKSARIMEIRAALEK